MMIVVPTATPPKPAPTAAELALAAALTRFLATTAAPAYLRAPGTAWLAALPAK